MGEKGGKKGGAGVGHTGDKGGKKEGAATSAALRKTARNILP
jgi:hypothetical protein